MADNRYRYPISAYIDNTISIEGFVDLAISRCPEVGHDKQQHLHECTQANTLSIWQVMQIGDNYLKDGHLMMPSLVILSLVTNIVATALH